MSARRELYQELMRGGPHSPDRSDRASQLIDDFVHELAEKLREAHNSQRPYSHLGLWCRPEFDCGTSKLIDTIDPLKSCKLGCGCACHEADPSPCDDCTGA